MSEVFEILNAEIDSFTNIKLPKPKTEENFSIQDYERRIEKLAYSNSSFTFHYAGLEQASIVLSKIVNKSSKVIRMVCGSLRSELKSNKLFLNSIEDFLLKGGELQILLDNFNPSDRSDFLELLKTYSVFTNIQIKAFRPGAGIMDESENLIHFMTGDSSIYRREYDCIEYHARGSFNNAEKAEELIKLFDSAFNSNHISQLVSILD